MLARLPEETIDLDDYRANEAVSEYKHEYHDGKIIEMTGATIDHNRIVRNLVRLLDNALRETAYEVFPSDLRLWIPNYREGLYPDVMVVAGNPIFTENPIDEILNPCLIIEVLSRSTGGYDRGDKFRYYRAINELQEYILVEQSEIAIDRYIKTGEREWLLRDYPDRDGSLSLVSLGLSLDISEIYRDVDFSLAEP
jgi:Uma2 family endonuclease